MRVETTAIGEVPTTTRLVGALLFVALLFPVWIGACAAPPERGSIRWVVPPLFEPMAFRIETELYDVPLALAALNGGEASAHYLLLGMRIDEDRTRDVLVTSDAKRVSRPAVTVVAGGRAAIPARPNLGPQLLASDYLDLDVRASISYGVAPIELAIGMVWRGNDDVVLGRTTGTVPLPVGQWIRTLCVPRKEEKGPSTDAIVLVRGDEAPRDLAVFGFVRAVPVHAAQSSLATLDPGDGIRSSKGALSNLGDVAIRFAIDGDGEPVLVDLGASGRACWAGDGHALAIAGGAHAHFACRGRSNTLSVTCGAADGGGVIEFRGERNVCTNVPNGFGRTEFVSSPDRRGGRNSIALGGEPDNVLSGPWDSIAP